MLKYRGPGLDQPTPPPGTYSSQQKFPTSSPPLAHHRRLLAGEKADSDLAEFLTLSLIFSSSTCAGDFCSGLGTKTPPVLAVGVTFWRPLTGAASLIGVDSDEASGLSGEGLYGLSGAALAAPPLSPPPAMFFFSLSL
jgi:hypothetical protein